jgi:CubicO group peptidase (beta-lactamase class C family)
MKLKLFIPSLFFFFNILSAQTIDSNVSDKIKIFDAWIESKIEYEHWPGVIIGLVYDQSLIWTKAYGFADLDKKNLLNEKTLFPIGSNTKMFTAIAIMKLRDEGKLDLDDPVAKYLPWIKKIKQNNSDINKITIRHLLTHTSGLPTEANLNYEIELNFPELAEIVKEVEKLEICFPTDIRWKYSNFGIAIAGEIISSVSGLTYIDYITKNILEPLNMIGSSFNLDSKPGYEFASGYKRLMPDGRRPRSDRYDYKIQTSAGGLNSNIIDLSKFAAWMFRIRETNQKEIISGSTLREMQHVYWIDDSWEYGLGMGFFIYHKQPNDMIGHGGHVAGYHTDFTIIPKDKIAIISLANADDIEVYPDVTGSISNMFIDLVLSEFKKTISVAESTIKLNSTYEKYIGTYRNDWNDYKILMIDGNLVYIDPKSNNPDKALIKLLPIEKNVFLAISDYRNSDYGERVIFDEDGDGNIRCMKMSAHTWEKVIK